MNEWTLCRLCLQSDSQSLGFCPDLTYNMIPILNIYFELVGVTMTEYPEFPQWICSSCESEMIQAYKFREKCLTTEEKLKDLQKEPKEQPKVTNFEFINTPKHLESPKQKKSLRIKAAEGESEFIDIKLEDDVEVKVEIEEEELQNSEIEAVMIQDQPEQSDQSPQSKKKNEKKRPIPREKTKLSKTVYKCEVCHVTFSTYHSIMLHMDKHQNFQRYKCDQCDKKFTHWVKRRSHIYTVHLNKTYCECSYCGKGFSRRYSLNNHIAATHGTERAHQCETCGKTFKNPCHLSRHRKTHKNVDSVKCETCGKILKNRKCLQQHSRIHKEEKNYICPVCSKAFTWNATLKSHVKRSHPDKVNLLPPDGTIVNKGYLQKLEMNQD